MTGCIMFSNVNEFVQNTSPPDEDRRRENHMMLTLDEYEEFHVKELGQPISLSIACLSFVDSNGAAISDGMKHNFTSSTELCAFVGLCAGEDQEVQVELLNEVHDGSNARAFKEPMLKGNSKPHPQPSTGESCFFCTLIMDAVEQSTANRQVDGEVRQVMTGACKNSSVSVSYSCMDWLQNYIDVMIDTLYDFTPKEVCQRINVCSLGRLFMTPGMHKNSATLDRLKINHVDLLQDNANIGIHDGAIISSIFDGNSKSNIHNGNSPTTAEQFDDGECKMCLYVVGSVKEQIPKAKGQTQPTEIQKSLIGLCNYLRKPESKKLCSNYIENSGENVIDVLSSVIPQELCILFLACPSSTNAAAQPVDSAPGAPKFHAAPGTFSGGEDLSLSLGPLKDDESNDGSLSSIVPENSVQSATAVPMPVLDTDDCTICFNMAMIVYQMVNDEIPIELDQALQRACSVIHPLYHSRCIELMKKYQEQLRSKILLFPRMMITEYCKEFEPPVCPPSPMYGLDPGNLNPLKKPSHHNHRNFITDVPPTISNGNLGSNSDEDDPCTCLNEDMSTVSQDQNLPLAGFDYEAHHETSPCELCQHAMFFVGPLMKNPNTTFEQVNNALTNSCKNFKGERLEQCQKLIDENRYYMEAKLFSTPRTPFYEVCYVMTDPLCSGAYMNKRLRNILMDLFLAEFPKNFQGNAEAFEFAREVSELVATVLFFREDLYSNIGNSSFAEASTTEGTTIDYDYNDDNETLSTLEPRDEKDGILCEICNEVVQRVKPYIQIPILQRFLRSEIDKSCYHVQPLLFSKCLKFVANYGDMLHETALYDISRYVDDICTLTEPQFCPSNSAPYSTINNSSEWHSIEDHRYVDREDQSNLKNVAKDETSIEFDSKKEALVPFLPQNMALVPFMPHEAKQFSPALHQIKDSAIISHFVPAAAEPVPDCAICNEIMEKIQPSIQGSKNLEEIKDLIMRACFSMVPSHFSQCLEFLPKYGPHLRDSIVADSTVPPAQICLNIKTLICSPISKETQPLPAASLPHQSAADLENLPKKLHPLGTGSLMRAIALQVCEHVVEKFLGQLENVCTTFLDRHWPEENHYYESPGGIKGSIQDCDVCQEMMTVVSMEKNLEKGEKFTYRNSLHESCQFLPSAHRWLCDGIVKKYGDEMVPYLERHPNHPMDVCTNLQPSPCNLYHRGSTKNDDSGDDNSYDDGQDQAKMNQLFVNKVLMEVRYYNGPNIRMQKGLHESDQKQEDITPDCLLCQDMVKEIRKILVLNHSKSIQEATENVCQYLPETARHNQCSEIVVASSSKIEEGLKWFVHDSPEYVCEQSELCDADVTDTDSKDPCKEGPGFWCLSFQNAEQCNQIEYCQAKYRHDDD